MKYAVTGSNGLVGKALTLKLAKDGHQVLAVYRSELPAEFYDFPNIDLAKGDIEDVAFLKRALIGVDGVFHVAGFAKPWAKNPSIYYQVNEEGTRNVCEACRKNKVKRLVYTASAGIHGPQPTKSELINENTWPEEYHTDYEQSKFNGMRVALSYEKLGLEVNIVSPARVYAPGEVTESNVPVRMVDIYLNKGFGVAPMDGFGIGSYVYIDDVVQGHILAMMTEMHGEEYLIGGENLNYIEFFRMLAQLSGKTNRILKVPYSISLLIGKTNLFLAETFGIKPMITTPWVRRYLMHWGVDSSKLRNLGYDPSPLKDGLKKVIDSWS